MRDVNKVILLGRLGGDPIQRFTQVGTSVVRFSVATKRWVRRAEKSVSSEDERSSSSVSEETQWHQVISWGSLGDTCAAFLKKGHPVYVEGSLRCYTYADSRGVQRWNAEIHAEHVSFLGQPSSQHPHAVPHAPSDLPMETA